MPRAHPARAGEGEFQSAPLREGRPGAPRLSGGHVSGFNPRPCARGDCTYARVLRCLHETFQSAPLREGRFASILFGAGFTRWFQSAPLREGRHSAAETPRVRMYGFNPRPCARGDR